MKKITKKNMKTFGCGLFIVCCLILSSVCLYFHGKLYNKNKIMPVNAEPITEIQEQIIETTNEIIEEPKVEIIKPEQTQVTSRGGSTIKDNNGWIKFTATAYCPCVKCCGKTNGITASGAKATAGRTVAMPKGYSFGTKIEIKGMGTYVVEDRGGAIKGNKIDIFFNTHQEALNFGRKTIYLKVVE